MVDAHSVNLASEMRNNSLISGLLMVMILFGVAACNDGKDTIPSPPTLLLKGVYPFNSGFGYDSFVEVEVGFEDADGDIGLEDSDTLFPFGQGDPAFYNLLVYYQEKKGANWIYPMNPLLGATDTLVLHQRLKNVTPTGKNKSISGNLTVVIPARPYQYRGDTVRYLLQLVDRKLLRSKQIVTPAIFLQHP
jgi:hypothetical protein